MNIKKIGIIREGKVPPDFRVALSPEQCVEVKNKFGVEVVVQSSPIRKFGDEEYVAAGISVVKDVSDCDLLMGIKEVPEDLLIPNKTYLFFSHTIKKQPHNAKLLRSILDKKIRLIDYEVLKGEDGKRIIGFGRYAGIIGAYEGFRAFGKKHSLYDLKSPSNCDDRKEMEAQMKKITLPQHMKIVVTGFGRVGNGAEEIMKMLPIENVNEEDYFSKKFDYPIYVHLDTHEYYVKKEFGGFDKKDFYNNPEKYISTLAENVRKADLYIACHLWAGGNPELITKEDIEHPHWRCLVMADVSCDTNGPIASTIRSTKISDPLFGYHRFNHAECDWKEKDAICVMAIDNLPCELPKDASEDFGNELIAKVFPLLLESDPHHIIWKATETTLEGELTPHFEYLHEYAKNA
ncbi:MAG: NAD(P)-dependent oxidoreductase [Flavobacteriales bacterium]|nr:NAD(P)-dependent oxidoreductase [Flavobacteriales bacterium]